MMNVNIKQTPALSSRTGDFYAYYNVNVPRF